jgi:acetolactate synthase-1/3 small subunit
MTIVIDASKTNAALVERNLTKLVNVIDVQDVTFLPTVARELALIKIRVSDATKRGELKQIADMFQSRVVDVSKESIMIEVTGEETKVDSMLNVLNDYGVIEVVRTGRIAMARG